MQTRMQTLKQTQKPTQKQTLNRTRNFLNNLVFTQTENLFKKFSFKLVFIPSKFYYRYSAD